MLEAVEVRDHTDRTLKVSLPVTVPNPSSSYYIKDVEGLGPVSADINTSSYGGWDGAIYRNSRTGERNMVLTIGYNPDYSQNQTVQDLRRAMYAYLPPKAEVTLRLIGGPNADDQYLIQGVVESCEPSIFSKDPEIQISILCPDGHFASIETLSVSGSTDTPIDISNLGSADAGFRLEVFGLPGVNIQKVFVSNGVDRRFEWEGWIGPNDKLVISTYRGNKYIQRQDLKTGMKYNVLDGLVSGGLSMSLSANKPRLEVSSEPVHQLQYTLSMLRKWVGF